MTLKINLVECGDLLIPLQPLCWVQPFLHFFIQTPSFISPTKYLSFAPAPSWLPPRTFWVWPNFPLLPEIHYLPTPSVLFLLDTLHWDWPRLTLNRLPCDPGALLIFLHWFPALLSHPVETRCWVWRRSKKLFIRLIFRNSQLVLASSGSTSRSSPFTQCFIIYVSLYMPALLLVKLQCLSIRCTTLLMAPKKHEDDRSHLKLKAEKRKD